ncbi:tetratricopeptide repeat protein [Ancylobacter sp. WKF20]|uniref:tetratricopeptide repeat protein n=1 Tax=Ancylobacter sp. WKF20 TaxID=3039801 RepID=UPI002434196E|nr:tetratricopeptide repeat protein [Ancylobacter sp. WKF20]WGD31856.1 tetratricopeptide repeat protein [Ancylobacter sp. WKF20]
MRERWISYAELKRLGPDVLRARISQGPEDAARWVEAGALNGLVNAQLAFGQMLVDGHGVPRDPVAGLRWFAIAAASGSAEGINMVGRCHELGWGVPADATEAARHYRAAAEKGDAWAPFNLATLLLDGKGVPADRKEALAWYVCAARRGNAKAMTLIGRYLEQGWDRPARPEAALRWYRRGAEGGDYRGQFDYARLLLERTGDLGAALPWFARAVENGVPAFCRNIGAGLRETDVLPLQRVARQALEKAATSGEPADLRAFAAALAQGLGAPPDPEAAQQWFARAREIEAAAPLSPLPSRASVRHSFLQKLRRRLFLWRYALSAR